MFDLVKLKFEPVGETAECFADEIARTLYLLWRQGHIVCQDFPAMCLGVAESIRKLEAITVESLVSCFPWRRGHIYWTESDVKQFCEEVLPYFTGEKSVTWELAK